MKHIFRYTLLAATFLCLSVSCTDNDRDHWLDAPEIGVNEYTMTDIVPLEVNGRYLVKKESGEIINLHGFAQTFSPYFNQSAWSGYDVDACLDYNKGMMDKVIKAGWKFNWVRQHKDHHWCSPGASSEAEAHKYFKVDMFMKYLNRVFIPMAEYAISHGLYVVMRPPGVCPETIAAGDSYNRYLIQVWDSVSNHPKLKNNPGIMFELANEPVNIVGADGSVAGDRDASFEALQKFLQPIVNTIRENGAENICWLPGLGYQSLYNGCAKYRVEGENLGYAIHCYCGWYGSDGESIEHGVSGGGYEGFQKGWDTQVKPVADIAPIIVTEIDWAPVAYENSWGKGYTGYAKGRGFGANFKYITDNSGNVSWLIFTDQYKLADYKPTTDDEDEEKTFLTDYQACPTPVYQWFNDYYNGIVTELDTTNVNALPWEENQPGGGDDDEDGGEDDEPEVIDPMKMFSLDNIDLYIYGDGNTYDAATHTLITAPFAFGGWHFDGGLDLSDYKYLVVEMGQGTNLSGNVQFRFYTEDTYWSMPGVVPITDYRMVIDMDKVTLDDGSGLMKKAPFYIAGFWSFGGEEHKAVINRIYPAAEAPTDEYEPPVF